MNSLLNALESKYCCCECGGGVEIEAVGEERGDTELGNECQGVGQSEVQGQ